MTLRKSALVLIALLLTAAPAAAFAGVCGDQVMTQQGPVTGVMDEGSGACVYKGLPFAAAPVGELRWKPPAPAPERGGVLVADSFGAQCVQKASPLGLTETGPAEGRSEDCLYLNVWRPAKSGTFPVMFWIHGGALLTGSGSDEMYWGDRLAAKEDVVVVTINYRLGHFGFLAHPGLSEEDPRESSGNYGLLDQIAAMEWVKANIAGFGGDPGQVTIFGESAGGWSVCNNMASPLAAGLFHGAILESGGCDTVKSLEAGHDDGAAFAGKLGCDGQDAVSCMRSQTPEEIYAALDEAAKANKGGGGLLDRADFVWVPHVDGWALNETPIEALRSGRYNQVPLMVGANRDEIKLFTMVMPGIRLTPKHAIRRMFKQAGSEELLPDVERLYPYGDYRRPMDATLDALGDMALGCKCFEAAEANAAFAPTYYYRFDYDDNVAPHIVGAAHGLEIGFAFDNLDRKPISISLTKGQTKRAQPLAEVMRGYWANFAKAGDPNGPGLTPWPAYDTGARERMILDLPQSTGPTDNVDKCEFWDGQDLRMGE